MTAKNPRRATKAGAPFGGAKSGSASLVRKGKSPKPKGK